MAKDLRLTATLNDQVSKGIDALGDKIKGLTARLKGEGDKQASQGKQAADRLLADLDKRERDRIRIQRASIVLEERIEKERGSLQTRASVNALRETKSRADATLRIERQASLAQASMVVDRFDRRIAIERSRHAQILSDLKGNDRAQEAELRRHQSVVNRIQMDKANLPNTPFQRLLGHLGQGPSVAMGPQIAAGTSAALRGVGVELMAMAGPLAAGALGFAGLAKGMTMAYTAAKESHAAEVSLRAVMQATGNTAGGNFEKLSALANGYQKVTNFQDEAVMSAQGVLLQFGQIGKETFPRALAAAIDLASLMGTDLKSAATDLGQALQDPETASRKLRTMNILLTQSQKDQLKVWMESGESAKAQEFILGQLESKAKGHAESTALATTRLGNAFGEAAESVGTVFFNAAQVGASALLYLAGATDKATIAAAKLNKEAFDKKAMEGGFANYGENVTKATGATLAFQKALEDSHKKRNPTPPPPPKELTEAEVKAAKEASKEAREQAEAQAIWERDFKADKFKAQWAAGQRLAKASKQERDEAIAEDEKNTERIYERRARVASSVVVRRDAGIGAMPDGADKEKAERDAREADELKSFTDSEDAKAMGFMQAEIVRTQIAQKYANERKAINQAEGQATFAASVALAGNIGQFMQVAAGKNRDMAIAGMRISQGVAIASTAAGAMKAFEQTGIGGFIAGAGIIAAGATQIASIEQQINKFAQGTHNAPGGRALVGEQGPEYVDLPAGSRVHTASKTQEMRQGGGVHHSGPVNINITMPGDASPGQAQEAGRQAAVGYREEVRRWKQMERDAAYLGVTA